MLRKMLALLVVAALAACEGEGANVLPGDGKEETVQQTDGASQDVVPDGAERVDSGPPFDNTLGWKVLNTGQEETWTSMYGVVLDGGKYQVFAAGALGSVIWYGSADGKWHHINLPVSDEVASIWAVDSTYVVVCGEGGLLKRWFDFGDQLAWYNDDLSTGVGKDLHGVSGSGKDDIWVVGAAGTLLHFDGSTWKLIPPAEAKIPENPLPPLYAVAVAGPGKIYFGGDGILAKYENGVFTANTTDFFYYTVRNLFVHKNGDVWIAADNNKDKGFVFVQTAAGEILTHRPNMYSQFDALWVSPTGLVYAAAPSPPPIVWIFDGDTADNWEPLAIESPKDIKDKYPDRILTNTRVAAIWGTHDENIFIATKEKQIIQYAVHE